MDHVRFGRTGLRVSPLCLGTMTFGFQCDEETSFAILDAPPRPASPSSTRPTCIRSEAPRAGRSHRGDHRRVARAGERERRVLATKCFGADGPRPVGPGQQSRKHIMRAIDASLRRLRTDYIDLYQMHSLRSVRLRSTRRLRRSTTSSAPARCATSAARTSSPTSSPARSAGSELHGIARFDCVQPRYNLLFREIERELLPLCAEEQVA